MHLETTAAPALHPKAALGRMLFRFCDRVPAAKSKLRHWGMRTAGERFGDRVGNVQLPDGRSFKLASISQDYLSFELFWRGAGYYEPITRLLIQEIVHPGATFIDVGANIGFYTLVVASTCPDASVVCFEPNPGNFALLTKNVQANALRNVRCEPLAVSNEDTVATLYLTGSHMSASLRAGFDGNVTSTTQVRTVALDSYLASFPAATPLVIKVDVEGHEEALFRGMQQTLTRLAPDIITEVTLSYSSDAMSQLTRSGYRFFQITDQGLIETPALIPVVRDRFVFLNHLMTTKPRAHVEAVFERIRPAVREINLRQTSKYLGPAELERFLARAAEGGRDQNTPAHSSLTDLQSMKLGPSDVPAIR